MMMVLSVLVATGSEFDMGMGVERLTAWMACGVRGWSMQAGVATGTGLYSDFVFLTGVASLIERLPLLMVRLVIVTGVAILLMLLLL